MTPNGLEIVSDYVMQSTETGRKFARYPDFEMFGLEYSEALSTLWSYVLDSNRVVFGMSQFPQEELNPEQMLSTRNMAYGLELILTWPDGESEWGVSRSGNLYEAIDDLQDKLEKQIRVHTPSRDVRVPERSASAFDLQMGSRAPRSDLKTFFAEARKHFGVPIEIWGENQFGDVIVMAPRLGPSRDYLVMTETGYREGSTDYIDEYLLSGPREL